MTYRIVEVFIIQTGRKFVRSVQKLGIDYKMKYYIEHTMIKEDLNMTIYRKAVAVVLRNLKNEVLLMQRGPAARSEVGFWENPGGGVEPNETPELAAIREIKEELGVTLKITDLLYSDEFPSTSEEVIWTVHIFEGHIEGEPEIREPEKCSGIKWYPISELGTVPLTTYTRADYVKFGWLPT